MARIKVKFELNKGRGRKGMLLPKFLRVAHEASSFLDMVAQDIGVKEPQWVAGEFDNNSVDFSCECLVEDQQTEEFGYKVLKAVVEGKRDDIQFSGLIRPSTWRQFAEIFKPIDADERVGIAVCNGAVEPEVFFIGRDRYLKEAELVPKNAKYYGEIQGVIHAFYKESDDPKLVIRELSTKQLVDCFFDRKDPDMYHSAIDVLKDPDAVVFVEGSCEEDRETGRVKSIQVKSFMLAPKFDLLKFEQALGAYPNVTGDLSSEEYIRKMRENGEHS